MGARWKSTWSMPEPPSAADPVSDFVARRYWPGSFWLVVGAVLSMRTFVTAAEIVCVAGDVADDDVQLVDAVADGGRVPDDRVERRRAERPDRGPRRPVARVLVRHGVDAGGEAVRRWVVLRRGDSDALADVRAGAVDAAGRVVGVAVPRPAVRGRIGVPGRVGRAHLERVRVVGQVRDVVRAACTGRRRRRRCGTRSSRPARSSRR